MAPKQSARIPATTSKTTTRKRAIAKKTSAVKKTNAKAPAKKLSAINAAAKVLCESKEPLNAKQMVERMAAKGYWTSPGGQTPHATLYAAILRDIQRKGEDSRFVKADCGLFALKK